MKHGLIRIIGGKWRGRRLTVPACPDLRPTPDRVRETLFNWLMPSIVGAYCLDLFAGTGALGFEALSRGASFVVMVEKNPQILKQLRAQCLHFATQDVAIYHSDHLPPLKNKNALFNLVFLDPPYQSELLLPSCQFLETKGYLAPHALIYLESATQIKDNDLPSNWRLLKSARAGQVHYYLAQKA